MADDQEFSYEISVDDFDKSLLPPNASTPGTDAFRQEVSKSIEGDFAGFGGYVKIVVDEQTIRVQWRSSPNGPGLREIILAKLKKGEQAEAIRMLELCRRQQPDNSDLLYLLGMALSDVGRLEDAERHLRHAVEVVPDDVNALVALGVALARQQHNEEATKILQQAVEKEPANPWAQRNLGACLIKLGRVQAAEQHLLRAVELAPTDQQALFGLAHAYQLTGKLKEADTLYARIIDIDQQSEVAEHARNERRQLAEESFRSPMPLGVRPDAVMYLAGALKKFDKKAKADVQKVAFEIAVLGRSGLDTNDPTPKYTLRNLPGDFSGLQLVCIMFVGFKIITPEYDIGFDLSKEYDVAQAMHRKQTGSE